MAKTIWQKIIDAFEDTNLKAYPIDTKKGECTKPYIVVKEEGSAKVLNYSSRQDFYSILCYVPKDHYVALKELKEFVKEIMDVKLYPMLIRTGQESSPFFDDEVKGYMSYIMYRNNVRDKHI